MMPFYLHYHLSGTHWQTKITCCKTKLCRLIFKQLGMSSEKERRKILRKTLA